jgi:LEA14-like dessication related protein
MTRTLYWIFLSLYLSACATLPGGTQAPTVTIADIRPLEFGLLEQKYMLRLRIQNPNAFAVPVQGLSYQLELNDRPFASGVSNQSLTLPSLGSEVVEVEAYSSLADIFQQLTSMRGAEGANIHYRLAGKLNPSRSFNALSFEQRAELPLMGGRENR